MRYTLAKLQKEIWAFECICNGLSALKSLFNKLLILYVSNAYLSNETKPSTNIKIWSSYVRLGPLFGLFSEFDSITDNIARSFSK